MANKSISLNSIKTYFNKIKTWVSGENKKLEEKIAVNRQTIGYESRNLFDFDSWYASITRTIGGTLSKIDNGCTLKATEAATSYTEPFTSTSSGVYKIPVFPNTTYVLSYIATGDYDTSVF